MNTKRLGNIGEAKTLAKFTELEVPVYQPFGDVEKSDLIAEFNGKLNKIQVKTSEKFEDGSFIVSLNSSTIRKQKDYKHTYTADEVDYFSIYNLESDTLLLVPIEKLEGRTALKVNIPFVPTHNQYEPFDWQDYTYETIIERPIEIKKC